MKNISSRFVFYPYDLQVCSKNNFIVLAGAVQRTKEDFAEEKSQEEDSEDEDEELLEDIGIIMLFQVEPVGHLSPQASAGKEASKKADERPNSKTRFRIKYIGENLLEGV